MSLKDDIERSIRAALRPDAFDEAFLFHGAHLAAEAEYQRDWEAAAGRRACIVGPMSQMQPGQRINLLERDLLDAFPRARFPARERPPLWDQLYAELPAGWHWCRWRNYERDFWTIEREAAPKLRTWRDNGDGTMTVIEPT